MSKLTTIFEIIILITYSITLINSFIFPNEELEKIYSEQNKNFISRAYNLTSISQLNSFLNQKKNIFLYFHSKFCSGCNELLTAFNKASSYELVYNSTNIILVDCSLYQEICFNFNLSTLPSLTIYYMHPEYQIYSLINYTFH